MKKLLNTLYVTIDNAYLSLDGENVVISQEGQELGRIPLHTLEGITTFGYLGASPALMGKCADMNKSLVFLTPSGRFLAKVTGKAYGNILLRREQYRLCDDDAHALAIAKNMISVKLLNCAAVINRTLRDHGLRINAEEFQSVYQTLRAAAVQAMDAQNSDSLRGLEGECASRYFSVFDQMILQQKEDFFFRTRSRRPPTDNVNALLSFAYSLLTSQCVSALEAVGLDPYCGVFHTERPGRCSLALDLVEEFRAAFADRFVLTLINKKILTDTDFVQKENGGVLLTDDGRKTFLKAWQDRKRETLSHPFLGDKVEWGILPFVQAMLLARYIRGDLDAYPPFIWK
ncbi:MAG: type I-C CRISPR-associated endonuclease Cas1c [Oscillospiraceae bacterium]|jgi:CRISPR-associated protein Cas1|nr:type I-C CRISPR-associated endonuclease Cas1c [Oscillospiraceae bacterium]